MDIRTIISSGYQLWTYNVTTSGIDGAGDIGGSGTIELEFGWQLIAVPIMYGYWDNVAHKHIHNTSTVAKFKNYIMDQITDLYGENVLEVANTYTGDLQAFMSYVIGYTPDSSPHNFNLVYTDNNNYEISGFWVKVIGPNTPYIINWGSQS